MNKLFILIPVIMLLFACTVDEKENSFFTAELTAELDSLISAVVIAENLPSAAVSIDIDGDIYSFSSGYENLETMTARKLDSQFRIASITKTFTATLILMLANDGLLSIDDPLSDYYPEFPNAQNITLKNLLMMRSGIADYANQTFLELIYEDPFMEVDQDSLIAMSAAMGDEFNAPDENTIYCNVNFAILGRIVEMVTGNDLRTELDNRIFVPYEMTDTYYPAQGDHILPGMLKGYCLEDEQFIDYTNLNPLWSGPAGAIVSTLDDLSIYVRQMFYGFNLSSELQSERLQTVAFAGQPDWVAYGQGISKLGDFWGHNGTIFGFSTEMWYQPDNDATIIINVNRLDLDDHSYSANLFQQISKLLFPEAVNW